MQTPASGLSPLDLYERCVQSGPRLAGLLRELHGGNARALREDFCGTAAVSRAWVESDECTTALAMDMDEACLAYARGKCGDPRLGLVMGDCVAAADVAPADVIFVGNFSLGYIHRRSELVAYLARSRRRLEGRGVFVCDTYAGATAFTLGAMERTVVDEAGRVIRYHWEHEAADGVTGMVTNSVSFRVIERGELVGDWPRAFVYRWRLWGVPELRDALLEAGFGTVTARVGLEGETAGAGGGPLEGPLEGAVLLAARV